MARDERKSNSRFVDLDQEITRSQRATYAAYLIAGRAFEHSAAPVHSARNCPLGALEGRNGKLFP
jgi:hypothetical protein